VRTACPNCEKQLIIPDEKIPQGASFKLVCPGCKQPFVVSPFSNTAEAKKETPLPTPLATKPLEPDFFPPGIKTALLVLRDQAWTESLARLLKERGFYVVTLNDSSQALAKLQVNAYDVILIEDGDWGQEPLQLIHAWPGTKRRKINVIALGQAGESLHPGISFRKGVDSYFHIQDHHRGHDLLQASLDSFAAAYLSWNAAAKKLGKEP
jgi:PleD family two-component response regulator